MASAQGRNGTPRRGLIAALTIAALSIGACQSSDIVEMAELAPADDAPIFSESVFGVPASPRVSNLRNVRKGGGREQVGKPYKVRGKWYHPKDQPGYVARGHASWYGANFHGRLTANGEVYDMFGLSAAHTTFPLPSYAMVTNLKNGNRVMVRINDRGPFAHGREIDVSSKAADLLGFKTAGIADVKVEYVGRAPLHGDDTAMLMASFKPGAGSAPLGTPDPVQVASIGETARSRSGMAVASAYAELPGVRPDGLPVPTPATRDAPDNLALAASLLSSYAPSETANPRAASAFENMLQAPAAGETIALGAVADAALLARIESIAAGHGRLIADVDGEGGSSLSLELLAGVSADAVLRQLWDGGVEDAFVIRD